jgi:isocitrate dehydrogenase
MEHHMTSSIKSAPVTVAKGDGIGPEIMDASLRILLAAGAKLDIEYIDIGERVYAQGHTSGIAAASWESLRRTKTFYKAPITTPQGGGFKSLNVTIRKTLGLFANIRPCLTYTPFIASKHKNMDVVIVRENEEDLYAGIEHRQTDDVFQCLKLITRPGTERLVRYAFEYARRNGRKKVTCFTKDNIMKMTDGLFHKVFDEIGAEYPEFEKEHWIVDIGAAKLADKPEQFDVVVLPNLYGDILSDVAAEIAGSVGMAGSANIGEHVSMFEAIHGSAPRRAGQNVANPSGLFLGGVMMLVHLGQTEAAEKAHNAWLKTIEDGVHTYDVFNSQSSKQKVGTKEFADAVIARLGQRPTNLRPVSYAGEAEPIKIAKPKATKPAVKKLVGVDFFVHARGVTAEDLAAKIKDVNGFGKQLYMITNRGVKVWPGGMPETFCVDHWRCRFMFDENMAGNGWMIGQSLAKMVQAGVDVIKTENLYTFDGEPGYSLGQGQ